MSSERRYLWIAVLIVFLLAGGLLLVPKMREQLAPEPRSALVAVEVGNSGVAEVAPSRIASGESFTLHAVLVAEDRDGEPFYYTEARALRIDGRDVDPDRIGAWDRPGEVVVLWFTVEGFRPFVRVEDLEHLGAFRFEEAFRPAWGRGWTAAGSLTPRNGSLARGFEDDEEVPFGTMRYHVRIEKYFRKGDPAPIARYRSPGAEALPGGTGASGLALSPVTEPTLVQATLPGGLDRPSAVFGLPQLEPAEGSASDLSAELRRWYRASLGFSRLLVLEGVLEDRDLRWKDLTWQSVELAAEPSWGAIAPGDFLRSGERVVVLYADRGVEGRLDYDDLCFDLVESPAVRRLGEIFTGGGVLDWAGLDAVPDATGDG